MTRQVSDLAKLIVHDIGFVWTLQMAHAYQWWRLGTDIIDGVKDIGRSALEKVKL